MLVVSYGVFMYLESNIEKKVIKTTVKDLQFLANSRLDAKFAVGISNAVSIANDVRIYSALNVMDREIAIHSLKDISQKYKKYTPFKNIKVHIHTKDNHSFIRSWKLSKHGDDLSSFRDTVVKVNSTSEPVNCFEIGKAGLSIRSVVPVTVEGEHLGSLEFIQGINSVAKLFAKNDQHFMLLLDDKYESIAKFIDKSKKTKKYILSQKFYDKNFFNDSKNIDYEKLKKDGYYKSDKYFYTYIDIKDFNNKYLGISLVGVDLDKFSESVNSAKDIAKKSLILITIILIIIYFTTRVMIVKEVERPLKKIIYNLSDSSHQIGVSSNKLQHSAIDLSQTALSQEASIEQMIANIKQSHENIYENSKFTDRAESISKETLDSAQIGFENMRHLIESIQNIESSSKEISNIVGTIDEIAFQTNLLALNAAVEAARAGEYGVGFAVVAEEVRNLATRSAEEAQIINQKVESTVSEIRTGTKIANESHLEFENIVNKINETTNTIHEIASSTRTQKDSNDQLNVAMTEVEQLTHNISTSSEETEKDAILMNDQAKSTKDIVNTLAKILGAKES
jgi:methyl-accepting chemotaxis protein